ncbi:MAG: hypothetical protein EPO32_04330 [Anaerolineae bacterium]|nr:MAG: hypothetical protein EPO32_04330 [Anaerolineae bacterium]
MKQSSKFSSIIIVLLLASFACSVGTGGADTAATATQTVLDASATALASLPTDTPLPPTETATNTPLPPTATRTPRPTDLPGVSAPIDFSQFSSGDHVYTTEFDKGHWEEGWLDFPFSFDARSSADKDFSVDMGDGFLTISLDDPSLEVFVFHEFGEVPRGVPVYIETRANNLGPTKTNNISLFCRASDVGWYEFSISSGGLWFIWRFTDADGYVLLNNGGLPNYDVNVTEHTIGASCIDDELTLFVDGEMPRNGTISDDTLREGMVGIGVYAADIPDVKVEFDYFTISIP